MIEALGLLSMLFVAVFTLRAYRNDTPTGAGQSRRSAIIEAWVNISIGFAINFAANLLIFPLFDAHISLATNWWIGWIYTAISIIRQYAIRRWFNDRIHRLAKELARG